jgi:hypothetical protein
MFPHRKCHTVTIVFSKLDPSVPTPILHVFGVDDRPHFSTPSSTPGPMPLQTSIGYRTQHLHSVTPCSSPCTASILAASISRIETTQTQFLAINSPSLRYVTRNSNRISRTARSASTVFTLGAMTNASDFVKGGCTRCGSTTHLNQIRHTWEVRHTSHGRRCVEDTPAYQ